MADATPPDADPRPPSLAAVVASTAASVAWLLAFALGARSGELYVSLGVVAGLVVGLGLALSPVLRRALHPRASHVAAGLGLGAASLLLTHALYPLAARVLPGLPDEVARLYAVAAITPRALVAVALIVLAEELLWRGALPRALGFHVRGLEASVLATASYTAAQLGAGSWLLGLAALGLGALWMVCARVSGALVVPVLCHAVWTLGVLGFWPLATSR